MKKNKKLFILSPFHYNYFIENINAVWISNNLFKNGDLYFYFLSYNVFKLEFNSYMFKELPLIEDVLKYKIKNIKDEKSLEFIKENLNDFSIYFLYPVDSFSYNFQFCSFISYFNIKSFYLNNNNDFNYLVEENFDPDSYNEFNKYDCNKIFYKKIFYTLLSNQIFSFFYSKTTTSHNIDLLFLYIDQILKKQIKKKSNNILMYNKDNSIDKYNFLYKLTGNNLSFLYMYVDFENEYFNINNKTTYKQLNYQYEINGNLYFSETEYNNQDLTVSKFQLNEIFLYLPDIFSIEEIYYKLLQFYEITNTNNKNEIVEYFSPINIKIDIAFFIKMINKNIEEEDYYDIYFNLNKIKDILKVNYKEDSLHIAECPFCINGKIYNGKNKFFCNNCNFFLLKDFIKKKFNFDLSKRYLKILLKNRYITINYNGENRILYLRETSKGYYLTLLKKR